MRAVRPVHVFVVVRGGSSICRGGPVLAVAVLPCMVRVLGARPVLSLVAVVMVVVVHVAARTQAALLSC